MSSLEELEEKAKKLVRENQNEAAVSVLNELLEKDPENHDIWLRLSIILMTLKKDKEAENAIDKALSIKPDETEYKLQKAYLCYLRGDKQTSEELTQQILEKEEKNIDALLQMAWITKSDERLEEAIRYIERIILIDPEDTSSLLEIIECHLDTNNLKQADLRIKQLVKLSLTEHQETNKNELLVRFFTEKAMETWTGSYQDEEGNTLFYPETEAQIDDARHYLEMAQETNITSELYQNRIAELMEVVHTNQKKLGLSIEKDETESLADLSEKDQQAWNKLEEIFDSWTNIQEEDGIEYRWPLDKSEIKASEKKLTEIKKLKIKNKQVKERFNELKNVVQTTKKGIPNYSSKFIQAFAISAIAIIVLLTVFQLQKFKTPDFNYKPNDWVINQPTQLVYDAFVGEFEKDVRNPLPLAPGTPVKPITRVGRYWMQVETSNGNLGYVYYRTLKGATQGIIKETTPLYTHYANKSFSDSIEKGQKVSILGYEKEAKEQYGHLVKVRAANGKTGIVPYYQIFLPFKDSVPEVSQTYIYPSSVSNLEKKAINASLNSLEEKYGPVSSIISSDGKKVAYFRQIQVINKDGKYRGVFFTLDAKNNVLAYELNKTKKKKLIDRLPLASKVIALEPFELVQFSFYKTENKHFEWWDHFKSLHWTTKLIGWIIQVVVGLLLILLFFSIPRLLINPIMLLFSHTRLLGNGLVLFINFLIYGYASYIFFIWMALLMNQVFTPLLFALPAFLFWWYVYKNKIRYNRCPQCHTMNIALDKGSSYHGRTKTVSWNTYNEFTGRTETNTQIINHYQEHKEKTTNYTDHYSDHRECVRCGYNWSVAREESAGSSTKQY
jgi:Tfp pilus assembly protein PilF